MATPTYPEDSLQSLVGTWWTNRDSSDISRGQLLWAFVPHLDQEPLLLVSEGRTSPTDHTRALYTIEPLKTNSPPRQPILPVAALPNFPGEVRTVHRAKQRPAVVISVGGSHVPRPLRTGGARWQTSPTMLIAPYYGIDRSGTRGGWKPEFVQRIRRCEYPQYMWDRLPLGRTDESILRLDHLQPIGTHPNAYEITPYCLSDEAMKILDEWLLWLLTGNLDATGVLLDVRQGLIDL